MTTNRQEIKAAIRAELEAARRDFHALLDSLTEDDLPRKSLNPGWTNGEILAHMLFGFTITDDFIPLTILWGHLPKGSSQPLAWLLDAFTGPFNWFNALGARLQGRAFTYKRIGELYDRVHFSLLKKLDTVKEEDWERGMYYPTKWDSNFNEFMTLEQVFHYPVVHFKFHLEQLAR